MAYYYSVLYFNKDDIKYSEMIGVYDNLDKAIRMLIELANYREDKNGNLTQYMKPTDDYSNMQSLYDYVQKKRYIRDYDKYVITEIKF